MAKKKSERLSKARKKIVADEQGGKGARSDELRGYVLDALTSTQSIALMDKMEACGTKVEHPNYTSTIECQSLYCAKRKHPKTKKVQSCYVKFVDTQKDKIATVLKKYATKAEHQNELRQVTILFSTFGFDTSGAYPVFPMDVVTDAIEQARGELLYLKNKFPKVRWRGGFSWEIAHPDYLGKKKRKTLKVLKEHSEKEGLFYKPKGGYSHLESPWKEHLITFHCHLIVDLNGTNPDDFYDACHKKWGLIGNIKRPVPDGVLVQTLNPKKPIEDSLMSMAQYPFRNQFDYKFKFLNDATDMMEYQEKDLEPEILSALIHALVDLKKAGQIIAQRLWK